MLPVFGREEIGFVKILSFSYCFPNHSNPNWGVFVFQRLAGLARRESLRVVSPVPWFPLLKGRLSRKESQGELWEGLRVYRPSFFYFPGFLKNQDARLYARGLGKWVEGLCCDWKPDILDAHFVWPDGVAAGIMSRRLGVPYTITLRGKLHECLPIPSQRRQCAEALSGAAAVINNSGLMAQEARKLGVSDDRLSIIPNGIDPVLFRPRDKKACRRELRLPTERRLLVSVAHLGPRKGHHEVIQALAGLPEGVRLVLVGGSAQGGTPEGLQQVAKEQGVADRLILTGAQPYKRVPLYFCAADASVLASYREGCPNAVLESLACGTPVVATDVGAVRDILPVPEAGRIVPLFEIGELRQALKEVLEQAWDPDEVVRASGVRSWDQVAEQVRGVLRDAISPRN